jgi:ADP-heptose:LPS heptosyltransferase
MFITSGNETATNFGLLKPWYVYDIPNNYIEKLSPENKHCLEITDVPKLYKKKYYYGCMQDNDTLCIKRLGGAGDVIWTLPVAKKMKELYPKCKILYWIADMHNDLLKNNPYIDGVLNNPSIDDLENVTWILDYYESIERYNPAEYEEAYDTHWKWAFNEDFRGDVSGNIYLTDKEKEDSKAIFGTDYIVVSMSSSNPKRTYFQLPVIIEKLAKTHKVIVTGQGNFFIPEIMGVKNLINKLNMRELFAVIANCKLLVASDSGNVHFACQFNKPVVGLYSTAHLKTRGKYYKTLNGIMSSLWCSACVKLGEYCSKEPECLSCISPDLVMSKIEGALNCNIPQQTI